ncbi:peroxidase 24-like [Euphorbia lathyris]|uniref:peroxidase 24-like n=1 Tax=Euphorbia lathyris TaxID=212925 RepID=UPI0033139504
MGRDGLLFIMISVIVILESVRVCNGAGLSDDFYKKSCPDVELIVRNITWNRAATNSVLGAKLLRMHFHDCFVRGCDASILLDSDGSEEVEKETIPNGSLTGYDVIDDIKDELERVCPGVVSCADILALAARDAVSFPFQKVLWKVQTGRRDGSVSLASEANENLPSPFADFATLKQQFLDKNLDVHDLVVLSGAHTLGVAHCATFSTTRLYEFSPNVQTDPSLDSRYANFLKTQCPNPANPSTTVEMDPRSSLSFDNNYFDILLQRKGLFTSDATLLTDPESAKIVNRLRRNNAFFNEFALSMKKMGSIQVLTGDDGEIRKNCRRVNPSLI